MGAAITVNMSILGLLVIVVTKLVLGSLGGELCGVKFWPVAVSLQVKDLPEVDIAFGGPFDCCCGIDTSNRGFDF